MVFECCVPYCKAKAISGFHNFPANRERRLLWLNAIRVFDLDDEIFSNSFRRVCKKHFLPDDYQTHANGLVRLKHDSVPSQCLPNPIWMEHSYVDYTAVTNSIKIKSFSLTSIFSFSRKRISLNQRRNRHREFLRKKWIRKQVKFALILEARIIL